MTSALANDRSGGRLGIIVPSSNTNLEPDCELLVPPGVTAHFTRLGGYDARAIPDAAAMRDLAMASIDDLLDLLMAARVDVIGYGCASATLSCGWVFDQALRTKMETRTGIPAVTVAAAMVESVKALNVSRIGFTSPYVGELNRKAAAFFADGGIEVVNCADVGGTLSSIDQGQLTPRDAFALGCAADHPEAEAIVIGCTDFRAVEAIADLERELGKPVITSNQALISACLARVGYSTNRAENSGFISNTRGARA